MGHTVFTGMLHPDVLQMLHEVYNISLFLDEKYRRFIKEMRLYADAAVDIFEVRRLSLIEKWDTRKMKRWMLTASYRQL
jgi:hypothetical protein